MKGVVMETLNQENHSQRISSNSILHQKKIEMKKGNRETEKIEKDKTKKEEKRNAGKDATENVLTGKSDHTQRIA